MPKIASLNSPTDLNVAGKALQSVEDCPCGTHKPYLDCCGRYIVNRQSPPTPEALMRSRYAAYSQANLDYISKTMKSPAADHFDRKEAGKWAKQVKWIQLEILKTENHDTKGYVEFVAHYYLNNQKQTLHETSEFHLIHGRWYYVDGS